MTLSKRPMTDTEFLEKVEWEGASYAFGDYGLSEADLDPDSELWPLAAMCSVAANTFESAVAALRTKAIELGLDSDF
jgi:hypothetical protein